MYYTTLKQLRKAGACVNGYNKLVRHIQQVPFTQEDASRDKHIRFSHIEPISLKTILDSNGFNDALWSLQAFKQSKDMQRSERLFAVWCARQVQHLMKDERSINAIDVAERHANGLATDKELSSAWYAARAAVGVASGAAAGAAAGASVEAAAAGAAAAAAARDAARDASDAAAWTAAWTDAWVAARNAAWDAQKNKFIEMFFN